MHSLVVSLSARRCLNDDKDINDIKDARSICLGRSEPRFLNCQSFICSGGRCVINEA